jgi:WD40 repeat protein
MIVAVDGNVARLWDVGSRRELANLQGHTNTLWQVAFSPDGNYLATASQDQTARLWDTRGRSQQDVLQVSTESVNCLAFSPDSKLLAAGAGKRVKLCDVGTAKMVGTPLLQAATVIGVGFLPDGRTLISGGGDGKLRLWSMASHREIAAYQVRKSQDMSSMALSPDGHLLATGGAPAELWDLTAHRRVAALPSLKNTPSFIVAFSPDGRTLAAGGEGTLRLWDVAEGRVIAALEDAGRLAAYTTFGLAFSPGGRLLAVGDWNPGVRLWDTFTKKEAPPLEGHRQGVPALTFAPDGKTLASGSFDHTVKLWNMTTREEMLTLKGFDASVFALAFSPDGNTLAAGASDGTVRFWHASPFSETDAPATARSASR